MWRCAIVAVTVLCACSEKKRDADQGGPAVQQPPPPPSDGLKKSSGSLALGGALTGTFTWKPDLALTTCTCDRDRKLFGAELTMTDGADTFISLTVNPQEVTLRSGKLKTADAVTATTGARMVACSPRPGTMSIVIDAKLAGPPGEVTAKGTLDFTCR